MSATEETRTFAPLDVVRIVLRRRLLVAATTLAAAAASVGLALMQAPRFEASTTVLLDASARGGLIGNLSMLSPLGASVVATSEVAVLRSRNVVESVVRPPVEGRPAVPGAEGYDRHVGLTTSVRDESLAVGPLYLAQRAGAVAGRPPVQRPYRLFAHAEHGPAADADTPGAVRVEFLAPDRVRVSELGLAVRLGLAPSRAEEISFVPGRAVDYRGLMLHLEPEGDVVGQSFQVCKVAEYEAVDGLLERYWAAETQRNSGVIRLTVEDTDPYRAAETANALVENYLAEQMARRERRSEHTLGYIEGLLEESRERLSAAQDELVRIRTEAPETIDLDASGEILINELAGLESRSRGLELRERSLQEVLDLLRAGDSLALARLDSAVTGGLFVDPATEGYLDRIASLNARYVELSQEYTDEFPALVDLRATADEILGLIGEQLAARIQGLAFQRAELEAERTERLAELSKLPGDMLALAGPSLEVRTQQELIPTLLANLKATEIADSSSAFAAQRLDRARPAVAVASPKLPAVLIVGAALGLLLGIGIALLSEPAVARVRGRADLEELIPRPLVGAVPAVRPRDLGSPAVGEAIRSLRAAVKHLKGGDAPVRVLGVSSVGAERIRAHVTAELARSLAREGSRVALVEGDLVERGITEAFGLSTAVGVAEALASTEAAAAPALAPGDVEGLRVLPAGLLPEGAERLGGARMESLLKGLAADHDVVLIDLPAAGSSGLDALVSKVDGVLLACAARQAKKRAVRVARTRIERAGGDLVGAVLLGRDERGKDA